MFFESPGSVHITYTVDASGWPPVTGVYMRRAIVPAVAQIEFQRSPSSEEIAWVVKIRGGVRRKDGTAGDAEQEHEFSSFWQRNGHETPAEVMAMVERFRPRAAAAITAAQEQ